jgi:polyisoprenoid-binding protein YceI
LDPEEIMTEALVAARQVDGRTVPAAGTWEIDPTHSSFEFVARHMMAKVRGSFTEFSGTRPVTWQLEFHGADQDPWGGQRAAFSAWTEVDRNDWDLSWNAPLETGGLLLSRNIRLEVDVELVKQQ